MNTVKGKGPANPRKASAITLKRTELLNRKCMLELDGKLCKFLITSVNKKIVRDGVTVRGKAKFRTQFFVDVQSLDTRK